MDGHFTFRGLPEQLRVENPGPEDPAQHNVMRISCIHYGHMIPVPLRLEQDAKACRFIEATLLEEWWKHKICDCVLVVFFGTHAYAE